MARSKSSPKIPVVKSADRTLDIFDLVGASPYQLSFSQIALQLGIPKSSLSQLLGNLVTRGYLELDEPTARYGLGARLRALAQLAQASLPIRRVIHDEIERLRDRFNETVAVYERRGDEIEIVDRVQTKHALQYTMTIGDRAPLYAHSAGKIVLSLMSDAELDDYLARVSLVPLGPRSPQSKQALRQAVKKVREAGIAFANEELASGICGYAAPVLDGKELIGIINIAVPTVRFNKEMASGIELHLMRAARQIANAIELRRASASPGDGRDAAASRAAV